jgi:hypothetical protein
VTNHFLKPAEFHRQPLTANTLATGKSNKQIYLTTHYGLMTMAISKIRVTVPFSIKETFRRLSDHANLKNIVDQVTTSELVRVSDSCDDINGLGAIRLINFKGDLLTEKVVAWLPPTDISTDEPMRVTAPRWAMTTR